MTAPRPRPAPAGPVIVDVQATQSVNHRDRGVARYTAELAAALWRTHPELVHSFVLNPDLAPPGPVEALVASGRLHYGDQCDLHGARLLHVCSPFELEVPICRLWPARASARGLRLAVTLYDLIPELYADRYLADPGLRRRYRARVELVRAADAVLAISETTARDAVELLGLPEERVTVVGAAAGAAHVPPASRAEALVAARAAVPGLEACFVLYTGGMDDRKNFEGLFRAWGLLPAEVREGRQLVMVCSVDDPTRNHLEHLARASGIEAQLLLPGFVSDDVLRLLYQSTELFVFPSHYEGFGLPVAEAMSCGARAIGSGTSAVAELLDPEARFDPADDGAIAHAIERALTDAPTRARLDEQAARPRPGWDAVAERTAEVYRRLLTPSRPRTGRRRPLVAMVTPLPPAASGVADYSFRLLEALRDHCDLLVAPDGNRYVDPALGPPRVPEGVDVLPLRALLLGEPVRGGYDGVVYCLGNSEYHAGALAALRRRSGVVLAHEVRLTDLYAFGADELGAVPDGFAATLRSLYPHLPAGVGEGWRLAAGDANRFGVLMCAEVVALADRFAVMSQFAAARVRLDIAPEHADKVAVVPFGMPEPVTRPRPACDREPIVASFGVVNDIKQNALLVSALPALAEQEPRATVAFVGPCADSEREGLLSLAASLGVADRVSVTGAVSANEYAAWLDRAAVAVQLRRDTHGESSASVADCLGAGPALVVTRIGAARELPDDAVVGVPPEVAAVDLARAVGDLLHDPGRRERLAAAARAHAEGCSFAVAAERLFTTVVEPASASGLAPARSD